MSKFNRGVFIFIGLSIWVLAMTQVFKPEILQAVSTQAMGKNMASVAGSECPNGLNSISKFEDDNKYENSFCYWQLVVTIEDMMKYSDFFK